MSAMNQEALDIYSSYEKRRTGQNKETPQWKACAKVVGFESYSDKSLKTAAGSMYVKRYFPPEAKAEMLEIIDYVREEFLEVRNCTLLVEHWKNIVSLTYVAVIWLLIKLVCNTPSNFE